MKIAEKEHEKTILDKKNKLVAGTKEILVLFEEANGLWINLQGKDRKEQIEKYKSICENEGKEYKEPTSVKSELKLHVSYEGWKKDDKRHSLVNNKLNISKFATIINISYIIVIKRRKTIISYLIPFLDTDLYKTTQH